MILSQGERGKHFLTVSPHRIFFALFGLFVCVVVFWKPLDVVPSVEEIL